MSCTSSTAGDDEKRKPASGCPLREWHPHRHPDAQPIEVDHPFHTRVDDHGTVGRNFSRPLRGRDLRELVEHDAAFLLENLHKTFTESNRDPLIGKRADYRTPRPEAERVSTVGKESILSLSFGALTCGVSVLTIHAARGSP